MIRYLLLVFALLNPAWSAVNASPLTVPGLNGLTREYSAHAAIMHGPAFQEDSKVWAEREAGAGGRPNSAKVRITIHKGATGGFARYSDLLPEGCKVESVVTDGASFSIADGKVRFVWTSVPSKETLEIEYTLVRKSGGKIRLRGEYSFIEDNRTRKFELKEEEVELGIAPAQATPESAAAPVKSRVNRKTAKRKEAEAEQPAVAGIEFRVQVGAFKSRRVTAGRLKRRFKLKETLRTEKQDGYTKFMAGSHKDYDEARLHKNRIIEENHIKSAFVVAYINGQRITVTEARRAAKQKR